MLWVVIRLDLFQIKYMSKWVILFIRNLVPTGHIVRALPSIPQMRSFFVTITIFTLSCQANQKNLETVVLQSTLLEVLDTLYYREPPQPPPKKAFLPDSSDLIVEPQLGIFVDGQLVVSDSLIEADSLERVMEQQKWFDSVVITYKSFDWEQYRIDSMEWLNSLNKPRPKKRIVLRVRDSLISNFSGAMEIVSNRGFEKDFEVRNEDELINKLLDPILKPKLIDFDIFSKIDKYNLEPEKYELASDERVVATLTLSRVVFNSEKTKAAYYYQENCGLLCGYGFVVFAELTSDGWKILGKNMVWIS